MSEKIFKVKAVAIDDNGKGIVRVNNETIFVDNLLEGEEGDIKTIYQFGKLKETKLLKRLLLQNLELTLLVDTILPAAVAL